MTNMKCLDPKIDERLEKFILKLNSLDFGPLAYKLMNPEGQPGLSFDQTIDAIKKYKGFLLLYYANKGKAVSPSRYIDYVWHTHILDTELYFVQPLYYLVTTCTTSRFLANGTKPIKEICWRSPSSPKAKPSATSIGMTTIGAGTAENPTGPGQTPASAI